jgi:hypothetical protein
MSPIHKPDTILFHYQMDKNGYTSSLNTEYANTNT